VGGGAIEAGDGVRVRRTGWGERNLKKARGAVEKRGET
jgi:hypothetical protein